MKTLSGTKCDEIFLSEMSTFDGYKYAYDTFFNCASSRFHIISQKYAEENGAEAFKYMRNTFNSWKDGYVRPNASSTYNIVTSSATSFTVEEKFAEACAQLAKHVQRGFEKPIQLRAVKTSFQDIMDKIDDFNLERTSYYAGFIYTERELQSYQSYVQAVFRYYTTILLENLRKDLGLFVKVYKAVSTAFLKTTFHTYLYSVELDISDAIKEEWRVAQVCDVGCPVSLASLLNNEIVSVLSLEEVARLSTLHGAARCEAVLTEGAIERIAEKKTTLENSQRAGTVDECLRTHSGVLKISLRVLSPREKAVIVVRVVLSLMVLGGMVAFALAGSNAVAVCVGGLVALYLLVSPIFTDITSLTKDLFRTGGIRGSGSALDLGLNL